MTIHAIKGAVNADINAYDKYGGGEMSKIHLILDRYLDKRGITRYSLSEKTGIRYDTINKYYRNRVMRYDGYILTRICDALDCDVSDILEYEK